MIAKRIKREQPSSFGKLARYIAGAQEKGEKLDDLWVVNSKAGGTIEDLNLAIREVEAQQALNTRVKCDKQYHLTVSFRDEHPSPDALRDIENHFAEALGFKGHPRVVGTHINTDNFHMHVAYSRIHPKTFKAHSPQKDFYLLEKVCREMEKKHRLQVDLGPTDKQAPSLKPQVAQDMEAHTWEQSFYSYVAEQKPKLLAARKKAKTWKDLHQAFSKNDLYLKKRGNGLVITSGDGKKHIKASSLDRSFSKPALEKDFGPFNRREQAQERHKPISTYKRRPTTKHPQQGRLWRQYMGQRRQHPSLAGKIYKTWREFLMLGVDEPLAMAIITFHKEMVKQAVGTKRQTPRKDIGQERGID